MCKDRFSPKGTVTLRQILDADSGLTSEVIEDDQYQIILTYEDLCHLKELHTEISAVIINNSII